MQQQHTRRQNAHMFAFARLYIKVTDMFLQLVSPWKDTNYAHEERCVDTQGQSSSRTSHSEDWYRTNVLKVIMTLQPAAS